MDDRTLELVAISASVAGHCQPCFVHHLGKARALDVSEEDVRKAISLATKISGVGDQRMTDCVENVLRTGEEGK